MTTRHELLIDAICGAGFPSMEFADKAEKSKLARFTGNQWNERWEWDRTELGKATDEVLELLYTTIKDHQHAR